MNQSNKTIIKVPAGTLYLSEIMNTLPEGIFNKKETGCGATHLVLTNKENAVVAVPLIELIDNKCKQLKGLFGVKGNVTKLQFIEYVQEMMFNESPIKIMVTYDSLPKLTDWLNKRPMYDI